MTNEIQNPEEYIYALAASPDFHNDGTLFAAKSSGLYRSTDRGQHWTPAFQSMGLKNALPTTAVACSPSFAEDRTVFAAVEGNVLRSIDGGETWAYSELGQPFPLVSVLSISPNFTRDGLLLAGTLDDGIIRSTNRSSTWQRWNFGLLDPHIYELTFAPDGSIFAGTESGLFRSTNNGRAWREVNFPMELAPVISLSATDKEIFVATEENGLHLSLDHGDTWQPFAPDKLQGSAVQVFADGSGVLVILDDGIHFTADIGKTWSTRPDIRDDSPISNLSAPLGLSPKYSLWVALSNGKIIQVNPSDE